MDIQHYKAHAGLNEKKKRRTVEIMGDWTVRILWWALKLI